MYILLPAVLLDLLLGDPKLYPHPVVIIGGLIGHLEHKLRNKKDNWKVQKIKGFILVLLTLGMTFAISWFVFKLLGNINYYLLIIFQILLFYTTIAIHGLHKAAIEIYNQLKNKKLNKARQSLDMIVGRNTKKLSDREVIRAVVETVAENTSDGIIAPLLYFLIGGPLLALLYKAVNTMDSMLGYKNEKYKHFGWAAAKLDDIVNYLPARITGFLFITAAFIIKKDYIRAFKTMIIDAKKHESPNAGFPESAVAGALRVQLGGINKYFGKESKKAFLGDKIENFQIKHIKEVIKLMYIVTFLFIIILIICISLIS